MKLSFPNPLAPYKWWVIAALAVIALGLAGKAGYDQGRKVQLGADHALIVEKNAALTSAQASLRAAAASLSAAAGAIREINAEAERRIAFAAQAKAAADAGKVIAERRARALREQLGSYQAGITRAKGKSGACRALYELDIDAELAKLGCTP